MDRMNSFIYFMTHIGLVHILTGRLLHMLDVRPYRHNGVFQWKLFILILNTNRVVSYLFLEVVLLYIYCIVYCNTLSIYFIYKYHS